jgi:hypothetical protein
MFWFHEIYDVEAPVFVGDGDGGAEARFSNDTARDLYAHYTRYGEPSENFHYFGRDRNQLFPLVSLPWGAGNERRRLGAIEGKPYVWTDIFGCHGSSGSGIFQRNPTTGEFELLGPVAVGGQSLYARLCMDASLHRPADRGMGYTRHEYVRAMLDARR